MQELRKQETNSKNKEKPKKGKGGRRNGKGTTGKNNVSQN